MGLKTKHSVRDSLAHAKPRSGYLIESCERHLTYSFRPRVCSNANELLPQSYLPWMCAALILFVEIWMKGIETALIVMVSGTALLLLILFGLSLCSSIGDEELIADNHTDKRINEPISKRTNSIGFNPRLVLGQ